MQFQSDVLGVPVRRPAQVETTALGAAALAGLATGVWADGDEFQAALGDPAEFTPAMTSDVRDELLVGWNRALRATKAWTGS